jgi:hypothetical protein
MSMITAHPEMTQLSLLDTVTGWTQRLPRVAQMLALAVLAVITYQQLSLVLQSPAQAIRRELLSAADQTAALSWSRSATEVQQAVTQRFDGRAVQVDAARFPAQVAVTVQGVDRITCLEARMLARRIEGPVVIALDGFRSAADCSDANAMSGREEVDGPRRRCPETDSGRQPGAAVRI